MLTHNTRGEVGRRGAVQGLVKNHLVGGEQLFSFTSLVLFWFYFSLFVIFLLITVVVIIIIMMYYVLCY